MPGGLDGFLTVAVPVAIFIFFGFMVYKNFKTEFDALFAWIQTQMQSEEDKNRQNVQTYYNPYLGGETIVYQ